MVEKLITQHDITHKLFNNLKGLISAHNIMRRNQGDKSKEVEWIGGRKATILEFLDSAIRFDYPMPDWLSGEKLKKAYEEGERLDFFDFEKVQNYIDKYFVNNEQS